MTLGAGATFKRGKTIGRAGDTESETQATWHADERILSMVVSVSRDAMPAAGLIGARRSYLRESRPEGPNRGGTG
jgi:hypothetical protein